MGKRHEGNGHNQTIINFVDRPGYVLICPHDTTNLPENIAPIVNQAMTDWLKKTQGIRVRAVLPIVQDGNTVAIHLWYDKADVSG